MTTMDFRAVLIATMAAGAMIGMMVPLRTSPGAGSAARRFTICHEGGGTNCVVDGDTAWIDGTKVRVLDIDAPETHPPRCPREAELGARATRRLTELLNEGAFELEVGGRDRDRHGRSLRRLVRNGRSLGDVLVSEGLARPYGGGRRPWC
jgi:endonuclease YncB( thermonuclease family)